MKKLNFELMSLLTLIFLALTGCAGRYTVERWAAEPVIKVLIAENIPSVTVEANGNHTVSSPSGSMPVLGQGSWSITNNPSLMVVMNGTQYLSNPGFPLKVAPDERTLLKLNGQPYRGWLAVTPGTSSGFNVINLVPLEAYLYGVVPREIGDGMPDIMAAIEAQAVCARSYAISHFGLHRKQGFDIYGDTRDQAYAGMARESQYCTQAVDNTRGLVAFSGDRILDARYSSTCGGRTADALDVWSTDNPALKSIKDKPFLGKPYCSNSPHFTWTKAVPTEQFYATLLRMLPSGAKIKSWELDINPKSRRVVKMIIHSDQGKHEVKGPALRTGFDLRSTYFKIKEQGANMVFEGHGWGHGSGMCQYGAMEMARRGKTAKQILRRYYNGVWFGQLYK